MFKIAKNAKKNMVVSAVQRCYDVNTYQRKGQPTL